MRYVFTVSLCLLVSSFALGQGVPPEMIERAQTRLSALSWIEGEWAGDSWIQKGPDNREAAHVTENAAFRLDRTLLILEGRGVTEDGAVVHSAVGVVSVDPATNEPSMRAYRPGGLFVDADIELTESGLIWGFDNPQAGQVRYTVNHTEDGEWHEAGEVSRDGGTTWYPFFGMTLNRVTR